METAQDQLGVIQAMTQVTYNEHIQNLDDKVAQLGSENIVFMSNENWVKMRDHLKKIVVDFELYDKKQI